MSEWAIREFGERSAELAYELFRGLGEAEAKRRLPGVLEQMSEFAQTMARLAGEPDEARAYVHAARMGFKTRGFELGFIGARKPMTMIEAGRRGRLYDVFKLLEGADPRPAQQYIATLGADPELVAKRCGRVWVVPYRHPVAYQIAPGAVERRENVGVVELLDFDAETAIGLVVWPLDDPDVSWCGRCIGEERPLGLANIERATDAPLRVHRTPARWLAASGDGVVLMSERDGAILALAPKWILAEDTEHARELARLLQPFADVRRILTGRMP